MRKAEEYKREPVVLDGIKTRLEYLIFDDNSGDLCAVRCQDCGWELTALLETNNEDRAAMRFHTIMSRLYGCERPRKDPAVFASMSSKIQKITDSAYTPPSPYDAGYRRGKK